LPIAGASGITAGSSNDSQRLDQDLSPVNHRTWQAV
jgi:hypothetical protein